MVSETPDGRIRLEIAVLIKAQTPAARC